MLAARWSENGNDVASSEVRLHFGPLEVPSHAPGEGGL